MSKSYKVVKRTINMGDKKGQTVYCVYPKSYGTLTSEEVAKQIAMESTATPGDVKAVLDRYAYYVKENLRKGYDIELLGFGTLYLRFLTNGSVTNEKKANASLVKTIIPAFRPSYYMLNGNRIYNLLPEKVTLVRYGDKDDDNETDGGATSPDSGSSSGDTASGGSGTGTGDGDGSSTPSYD